MYNIFSNSNLFIGKGSRINLTRVLRKLELKKVFLVIGKNSKEHGIQDLILPYLDSRLFDVRMFNNIKPNPTIENVKDGLLAAKEFKPEVIVAVGGGSVIDAAKAINLALNNPELNIADMNGEVESKNTCTPLFALPTTAGTGTEVTPYFVITNEEGKTKMCCVNSDTFPMYAILDIDLMEGMPRSLAASTGMDGLTHAIESATCNNKNDVSEMYSLQAVKTINKNILKAVNDKDEKAREQMALGSYMAGFAFCNSGLGLCHAISHQLGGIYDMPHGECNAILLPHIIRFNGSKEVDLYNDIAKALGLSIEGKTNNEINEELAKYIETLNSKLGINKKLKEYGVLESDFMKIAGGAIRDLTYKSNIYHATVEDIMNILKKAF